MVGNWGTYLLYVVPALVLGLLAQAWVRSATRKGLGVHVQLKAALPRVDEPTHGHGAGSDRQERAAADGGAMRTGWDSCSASTVGRICRSGV